MPPKATKPKSTKEEDKNKKQIKKGASEENESVENQIEQPPTTATPVVDTVVNAPSEVIKPEVVAPPEEVIDIKYEEPVLTLIIVEKLVIMILRVI